MNEKAALLVVDLQNDFCSGGALPVPNGEQVIEPVNRAAARFAALGLPVLASRDWHPPQSRHFREYGGTWPIHCVQGSDGAAFHPGLRLPAGTLVFSKGINPELDGYSAFEGVTGDGRPLESVAGGTGHRAPLSGGTGDGLLYPGYCHGGSAARACRHGTYRCRGRGGSCAGRLGPCHSRDGQRRCASGRCRQSPGPSGKRSLGREQHYALPFVG